MLSTLLPAGLFVVALVGGYLIGQWRTGRLWNRVLEDFICAKATNHAAFCLRALKALRSQRLPDAFRTLENGLDGEVITFWPKTRALERSTAAVMRSASDYRSRNPWPSERAEIQNAVQEVFTKASWRRLGSET